MAIQAEWCSENPVFLSSDNACAAGFDAFSRLCFPPPPLQQQQQPQQQFHFLQQKVDHNLGNMAPPMHHQQQQQVMADFPLNLAAEFEKQKLDMDRFLCLQNERLRFAVQEQRKEQLRLILRTYEAKTQALLQHKDEEMTEGMSKRAELERLLRRLESENQTWVREAKEKEAMVASLSTALERVRESACLSANAAEDAESCCEDRDRGRDRTGGGRHEDDDQVLFFLDQGNREQGTRKMVCKSCNLRSSCVIFLPCRHISSCKPCEAFLHSCPICRMPKKAIIEALL